MWTTVLEQLKIRREGLGISLKQLADSTGLSATRISKIESMNIIPNREEYEAIDKQLAEAERKLIWNR